MKKINLLLAVTALLMLVSCQNAANTNNNENDNNSEKNTKEVFDISKISIKPEEEKFFKHINTISFDKTHYVILLQLENCGSYIEYDGNPLNAKNGLYNNYISANHCNSKFFEKYFEGTIDYLDPDSFTDLFELEPDTFEILDNTIYVYCLPMINLSYYRDYICEQEEGHFLTLSDGKNKVHYELDLSVNNTTRDSYDKEHKLIKKTNIDKPYKAVIDNPGLNFMTIRHFTNENNREIMFYYQNEKTIIDNILTYLKVPEEINYKNYKSKYDSPKYKDMAQLFDRYNVYYTGSFYDGIKLKYYSSPYEDGGIYKKLYMDFELDSVVLYDQYEDLPSNTYTVLEYIKYAEDGNWNDYDTFKVQIEPEILISPIENKVVRLFDLGMYR